MWMFCTCIDFELGHLLTAEWAFGQHALDSLLDSAARVFGLHVAEVGGSDAAWVAAVAIEHLFVGFTRSKNYLVDVDDDDEVTCIDVGCVNGFVFAA